MIYCASIKTCLRLRIKNLNLQRWRSRSNIAALSSLKICNLLNMQIASGIYCLIHNSKVHYFKHYYQPGHNLLFAEKSTRSQTLFKNFDRNPTLISRKHYLNSHFSQYQGCGFFCKIIQSDCFYHAYNLWLFVSRSLQVKIPQIFL